MNGKGRLMPSVDFVKEIIKDNPVLPAQEQLDLVRKWQESSNKRALDQLVLSNIKIISKEASKIKSRNYYISYEDLMQEGIAGILKAANMFDSTQEVNFLTYAIWWIKANMKRYVMDYRSVVKMGTTRDDRTLFSNLSKTTKEAEDLGLTGDDMLEYIAKALSVKKESLNQMIVSLKGSDVRLDAPLSAQEDNDATRLDVLPDRYDYEKGIEDADEFLNISNALKEIVPTMPELERQIIESRILSDEPKTLRELETELKVSREWVRKVEAKALNRLRKRLKVQYGIGDMR